MTDRLSRDDEREILHAMSALLETERDFDVHGRDTSVSAEEIDSAARRLAARFGRPNARPVKPELVPAGDIDLEWLILSESSALSFRGSATQDVDAPAMAPTVLEVTDATTSSTMVVSGIPAEGRWTVRVIGAPLGRYAVELSWSDATEVSSGEVHVVSARPASVVLSGPSRKPLRLRLRPLDG